MNSNDNWLPYLITAVGLLINAVVTILINRGAGDKNASEAWQTLLAPLKAELKEAQCKIEQLEREREADKARINSQQAQINSQQEQITRQQAQIDLLTKQVISLGGKPVTEVMVS